MSKTGHVVAAMTAVGIGLAVAGIVGRPGPPLPDESASWDGPAGTHHPVAASDPVQIEIDSIDVDARVISSSAGEDGQIEAPPPGQPWLTSWYDLSVTPGEAGAAVILGHVDAERGGHGREAVFYRLGDLDPGDEIRVARRDGNVTIFRVDRVRSYARDELPMPAVFGGPDHPVLRLITCGGPYLEDGYRDNVVVFATMTEVEQRRSWPW